MRSARSVSSARWAPRNGEARTTSPTGREFKTQTAAIEHFRAILHAYGNGSIIEDPAHHDDLVALLERYDAAITDTPSKIGVGIERFERRLNAESGYSTPGFWVVRSDGSATDFSFYTGVKGEPKPQSQEFADACRSRGSPRTYVLRRSVIS